MEQPIQSATASLPAASALTPSLRSEHGSLPLRPLDTADSRFVRLLFALLKKRYGMVPTAFRVLYARSPFLAVVSMVLYFGFARALRIESSLRVLLQLSIAMQAGCTFCSDLQLAEAARTTLGRERFRELLSFDESSAFGAREKAALAYTRALQTSLHVPDAVWQELGAHFTERERVDIVWVCAAERYFNSLALPLRIGSDGLSRLA